VEELGFSSFIRCELSRNLASIVICPNGGRDADWVIDLCGAKFLVSGPERTSCL